MPKLLRFLLTPLVLAAALGLTWLVWDHEYQSVIQDRQVRLDMALHNTASRIQQTMAAHQQILRGVQGLFAASSQVKSTEFHSYIEALQLNADFSGIDGIGIVPLVPQAARVAHEAALRQQGATNYQIWPQGNRPLYAPMMWVEPPSAIGRALLGFDSYTNPQRRAAMELARDANVLSITSKLNMKTANGGVEPGFIMYLPLYRAGAPHDTLASRRANLIGWTSTAFRVSKLIGGLYGEHPRGSWISIFDGVALKPQNLLYASPRTQQNSDTGADSKQLEYVDVAGRTWTIVLAMPAANNVSLIGNRARLIAVAGIILSLLLALLTWVLVSGRERAYALATSMTEALRTSEARYRHLAQHDRLTDLPNLSLFTDRLQQALMLAERNQQQLAVLFIDLDQFKPVNDALGHQVGDLLLQAVAKRLHECLRASDTVARIGGDEFVLLLPAIGSLSEVMVVASNIRDRLNQSFEMEGGQHLNISCSIGIALYPKHGRDGAQLLKQADQAMYCAKRRGRNQVCCEDAQAVA
ncbi:MAG: diguanylate cyclase [Herbaspirillum sp.]